MQPVDTEFGRKTRIDQTSFSEAVARGLHKLTAYKDEYEVARLLTDPAFESRLAREVPGGRRPG